jgi:transcriptional regulator with XRE-family HTH domain
MPNRTSPIHDAAREATWANQTVGRELRVARICAGRTQRQIGEQLGHSKSEISRREHGRVPTLSTVELSRHAAAVGLRCFVRLYPAIRRPLDQAQLNLLHRLRSRIGPQWSWKFEVPMPIAGDLRAADALIRTVTHSSVVEAITRFADAQSQERAAHLKKRDLHADSLILLVAGSSSNRSALRAAGPILDEAFPFGTREALLTLAAGKGLRGDALIVL